MSEPSADTMAQAPEFALTIHFVEGEADPVRTFNGLARLLDALLQFDRVVIGAVDPLIHAAFALERVEAGSVTAWVRNKLTQVDDQPIRDFDWKKMVGSYALKAKYRALDYLNARMEAQEAVRLQELRDDLEKLARSAEFRHLPLPAPLKLDALVEPLDAIQDAKSTFENKDRITISSGEGTRELDLNSTKHPSEYLPLEGSHVSSGSMEMVLLVKKPDYLGDSKWEFRHGSSIVTAHVLDGPWVEQFRRGREVIVPGSALVCSVAYEYAYDDKGALQSAKHDITRVHRIVTHSGGDQGKLWSEA